jgi:hypothetical protein
MHEGAGALAWLTGDFRFSVCDRPEIAQMWNNNGLVGLILYPADDDGYFAEALKQGDMGLGPGAVAWLTGNLLIRELI